MKVVQARSPFVAEHLAAWHVSIGSLGTFQVLHRGGQAGRHCGCQECAEGKEGGGREGEGRGQDLRVGSEGAGEGGGGAAVAWRGALVGGLGFSTSRRGQEAPCCSQNTANASRAVGRRLQGATGWQHTLACTPG